MEGGWQRAKVRGGEGQSTRGRKREARRCNGRISERPVWVAIQIGVSSLSHLVPLSPSPAQPSRHSSSAVLYPFQVVSPRQSSDAAGESGASRNLSLVENHRGNKVKAPSGTSRYRIPNRNYEPWPAGYIRARRTERIIDRPLSIPRKIERRKVSRSRRTRTLAITIGEKKLIKYAALARRF